MKPIEEPHPDTELANRKRSRLEEAQSIVEEYVNDLREIIKKLRRRLH